MNWAITDKGYSQRRACSFVGVDRKTFRYAPKRPDAAALRQRLRDLASERRRFGYRRLHLLLRREGREMNPKKLYRLYREERLTVRKRGGRKRFDAIIISAAIAGLYQLYRLRELGLSVEVYESGTGVEGT